MPWKKIKTKPAIVNAPPHKVGTVAMVNREMRFVLLDVGTFYTPAPGSALKTFTSGIESGTLSVTGERRRPFIAADIASGEPIVGDDVFE